MLAFRLSIDVVIDQAAGTEGGHVSNLSTARVAALA